jgi:hypothetical protein
MAKMVTNTSASLKWSPRLSKIGQGDVFRFSLFVLIGSLVILRPFFVLIGLGVAAALGFCWWAAGKMRSAGLESWQVLALIALTGYLLLNYGFENLSVHIGGFPVIISYGLMFASLALAVYGRKHLLAKALREPAIQCMLALLVLTFFHLVVDLPAYGIWAIRDSSMCLDGIFMLLGFLWAIKPNSTVFFGKWLMIVFVVNMVYSFTLPWSEKFWSWSPQSGVFLSVPLLGNFDGTGDVLLAGALFCICVGGYVITRRHWTMLFLALAQFLGIAIMQVRQMYVATAVALIILVLLGETKKFAKLFILLPAAIIVILVATTVGGLEISGRIGVINLEFFKDHIRSIQNSEGTPGSSVESRYSMADEAFQHFLVHPVVGEGFGQPLLTVVDETNNTITRMPHNSSLSYLARLGTIGFALWIAFHWYLVKRFIYALRRRHGGDDKRLHAFILWLFLFYVLFMISSLVEGAFEFPSGAISFYFFMGFALGLMRWQLSDKKSERPLTALSELRG